MKILLRGKLKYINNHIYYHYGHPSGGRVRKSIGVKVDHPEKNSAGEWIFPARAYEIARKIDDDVLSGKYGLKKKYRHTFNELLTEYLELDGARTTAGTRDIYTNVVRKLIEYFSDMSIEKITSDNLIAYRNYLLNKLGNTEHTAAKEFRHIAALFAFAVRRKYIEENPVNKYNRPRPQKKPPEIYTDTELVRLVTYMQDNDHEALKQVMFLLLTGFRVEESCNIRWDQVKWEGQYIKHHNQKGRRDDLYPISDYLASFLDTWSREYSPYIFKYRDRTVLHKRIRYALDRCGIIKRKAIHTLKKNYSTYLALVGTPGYILPDLAHHKSINTTRDSYLFINMDEKRKWLNAAHNRLAKKLQFAPYESIKMIPAAAPEST